MNFLENIFARLKAAGDAAVLQEIHEGRVDSVSGNELLVLVAQARSFIARAGLRSGERCALLGPEQHSLGRRRSGIDGRRRDGGTALFASGARGTSDNDAGLLPGAIVLRDHGSAGCECCGVARRSASYALQGDFGHGARSDAPAASKIKDKRNGLQIGQPGDPVTIIYTSGTSGEPKGVMLTLGNLNYMMSCTTARLDRLMEMSSKLSRRENIFHYLPLSFAASWLTLLSALSRKSVFSLSMDLNRIADEIKIVQPDYFLNVPTLLERIRGRVEAQMIAAGPADCHALQCAKGAFARKQNREWRMGDALWLGLGNAMLFRKIRGAIGPNLKALICGSAPLAVETQRFFMMLGIPVLQAYGLTETTGICTLDDPRNYAPGFVGQPFRASR